MKKENMKKFLTICMFLMGLVIFSVLPVQAAAPKMYTLQPGKTYDQYDITGDGEKDKLKIVQVEGAYDGYWAELNLYVNSKKAGTIKVLMKCLQESLHFPMENLSFV